MFNTAKKLALLLFALGAAVILTSCEPSSHPTGKDGYHFETEEKVVTHLEINVVLVQSPQEMKKLYFEKTGKHLPTGLELEAFATLYPARPDLCTLYMLDPRVSKYEPEFIGHEFSHCIFGNWHKTQDERRGQT